MNRHPIPESPNLCKPKNSPLSNPTSRYIPNPVYRPDKLQPSPDTPCPGSSSERTHTEDSITKITQISTTRAQDKLPPTPLCLNQHPNTPSCNFQQQSAHGLANTIPHPTSPSLRISRNSAFGCEDEF
jgi:hypothetical protein